VLEALSLNISKAAEALGAPCETLSDLLNGITALSPEMALRLEKGFDVKMDFLLRIQALYDTARCANWKRKSMSRAFRRRNMNIVQVDKSEPSSFDYFIETAHRKPT